MESKPDTEQKQTDGYVYSIVIDPDTKKFHVKLVGSKTPTQRYVPIGGLWNHSFLVVQRLYQRDELATFIETRKKVESVTYADTKEEQTAFSNMALKPFSPLYTGPELFSIVDVTDTPQYETDARFENVFYNPNVPTVRVFCPPVANRIGTTRYNEYVSSVSDVAVQQLASETRLYPLTKQSEEEVIKSVFQTMMHVWDNDRTFKAYWTNPPDLKPVLFSRKE